jgi:alpha-galactosidase
MKLTAAAALAALLAIAGIHAQQSPAAQDVAMLSAADAPPGAVWIDTLDLTKAGQRAIRGQRRPSNPNAPPPAKPALGGVTYAHVLPLNANNELWIDVKGQAARFVSMVGIDDVRKSGPGSVTFEVWADGKKVADSGVMRSGDAPKTLSVDLKGVQRIALLVGDAGDLTREDDADWGGAMVVMQTASSAKPETIAPPDEPAPAIASAAAPATPRINNPRVTGGTPGRPFLFLIPASGEGPLSFAAKNLPAGLQLDSKTGIISGSLQKEGKTDVQVTVRGPRGSGTSTLTIVSGKDALALTPPLGWNSWNVWAASVSDEKVRAAADDMVKSGLASHGYQYVNIDDTWEGARNTDGEITSNERFPDMKALTDYVHSKGLKIGIYSSPGPRNCQQRFAGSYQHEAQDAATYAKWGFDYLKYDWCSYREIQPDQTSLPGLKKPYTIMREALDKVNRDIVFSLCQYGMGNVWEWGDEVGGNLWRTTGDITDTWASMSGIGFAQNGHEKFGGPGHWNDPDMLVVGKLGWGPQIHDTRLTKNEQMTHISLWSLVASPLLIGADMSQLDQFTTALLGNDEVLGVSQDVLGKPAGRVTLHDHVEVWARPLVDGTMAVGLFNRGPVAADVKAEWTVLGVKGAQKVRDLWQQKDLGTFRDEFTATVPRHGAVLVKIGAPRQRS